MHADNEVNATIHCGMQAEVAMVRVVVLIGLFLVLLWAASMSEQAQAMLMFTGIFAVCWTVDRWGMRG